MKYQINHKNGIQVIESGIGALCDSAEAEAVKSEDGDRIIHLKQYSLGISAPSYYAFINQGSFAGLLNWVMSLFFIGPVFYRYWFIAGGHSGMPIRGVLMLFSKGHRAFCRLFKRAAKVRYVDESKSFDFLLKKMKYRSF